MANPYQFRVVLSDGKEIFGEDVGQSFVDSFGDSVARLEVNGKGLPSPFRIDLPRGAVPVVFRRFRASIGVDGESGVNLPGPSYFFGWQSETSVSLWEFGNGLIPIHHDKR